MNNDIKEAALLYGTYMHCCGACIDRDSVNIGKCPLVTFSSAGGVLSPTAFTVKPAAICSHSRIGSAQVS
jgi:hypothetical protein